MQKLLTILFFTFISLCTSKAQVFPTAYFGGFGTDRGVGISSTTDNDGFIIVGYTTSFKALGEDVYIVRTDLKGNLVWEKTYGGAADDNAWSITKTNDGNYIVVGFSKRYSDGDWDIFIFKIDNNGNELWSKNYKYPNDQFAWEILTTLDGNYVIVGQTNDTYDQKETSFWMKINENGDTVWYQQLDDHGVNRAFSIIQVDSSFYISGLIKTDSHKLDGFIAKITSEGRHSWIKTYGGEQDDLGHALDKSSDGNLLMSGYSKSFGTDNNSPWLVKTDLNGEEIWSNTYGTQLEERIVGSYVSKNGPTTLLGYVFKKSNVDLLLIQVDNEGQLLWMKTIGSLSNEESGQSILESADGQIVFTGRTYSTGNGKGDLFLMIDNLIGN